LDQLCRYFPQLGHLLRHHPGLATGSQPEPQLLQVAGLRQVGCRVLRQQPHTCFGNRLLQVKQP